MASQVVNVRMDPGLRALARELRGLIRGEAQVDAGARARYATDVSNYRHLPIAVVTPRDDRDNEAVLGVCPTRLLPVLPRARRLAAQTVTLAEFLRDERADWNVPSLEGPVRAHGHCHDKSVLSSDAERNLLQHIGARNSLPKEGCCGMAGAPGFEAKHHDLAQTISEGALLPAVRAADPATAIVADGFSCHEQIPQNTGKTPIHLAQLLAAGLPAGTPPPSDRKAEQ